MHSFLRHISVASLLLSLLSFPFGCRRNAPEPPSLQRDSIPAMGFWPDSLDVIEERVRDGETFTGLMVRLGMSHENAYLLSQACDSVFDMRRLRAGNTVKAYFEVDTLTLDPENAVTLSYVVYERNRVDRTIFKTTPPFEAWKYSKPVEVGIEYSDVTISSSLWKDMLDAGVSPMLIVSLSEIYAWTVDFFGLQEGDRFKVLYGQKKVDGEVVDIDTIHYAEFVRDDTIIPAIRFDQGDGTGQYWTEEGESLKKAFLKAPLKFTRISSGFSYNRRHPVTGKVRAHTAVDYAAPTGTPVMSIGNGTVISAGWGGGGGNTVKIRHNSTYTTAYLHLSRYAKGIKAGARVQQGDVIGYVGSTGVSTGPHLDFRVWKNGSPINPLTMESVPDAPLKPENMPALDSVHSFYKHIIDSLATQDAVRPAIDTTD